MILPQTRPLRFVAGMQLLTMAVGLMAAAMALRVLAAIGWRGLLTAFSCYGLVAAFVVFDLDRHAPHQRFGAANSVTLARAALTALLWGVVGSGPISIWKSIAFLCWRSRCWSIARGRSESGS